MSPFRNGSGPSGIESPKGSILRAAEGGRFEVVNMAILGLAEKAGLDFGDYVSAVDVEQPGRPDKKWVYPLALVVLALVIALQRGRYRRETAATAGG